MIGARLVHQLVADGAPLVIRVDQLLKGGLAVLGGSPALQSLCRQHELLYQLLGEIQPAIQIYRSDWDIAPAFVLIGLLAQFLPWVLVPRGTYIYHYFASVPFLILGTTLLLDRITKRWPVAGKRICIVYLVLCLVWFILLFPYASGIMTADGWMDFIRDYPYINQMDGYWSNDFLINLNAFLEKIPILPHVYHN